MEEAQAVSGREESHLECTEEAVGEDQGCESEVEPMPDAPDITKAVDAEARTVTYASCSPMADIWMRQGHGDRTITFDTLTQRDEVIAFEAAARTNGFRI